MEGTKLGITLFQDKSISDTGITILSFWGVNNLKRSHELTKKSQLSIAAHRLTT